jgi:hypothetical protein
MADIGNTTPGGSIRGIVNTARGIQFTMPEAGTLESITARLTSTGTERARAFLYDTSDNLLDSSTAREDIGGDAWYTFSGMTFSLVDATTYVIAVCAQNSGGDTSISWASGETYDGYFDGTGWSDVDSPPDPAGFVIEPAGRDHSIYATYTTGGASAVLGRPLVGPFGGPLVGPFG